MSRDNQGQVLNLLSSYETEILKNGLPPPESSIWTNKVEII